MTELAVDPTLEIRRAIASPRFGPAVTLPTRGKPATAMAEYAVKFGRSRRIGVKAEASPDGSKVTLSRIDFELSTSLYPEMDALKIGQSHVFHLPVHLHQRIRLAASNRSRQGKGTFTCSRVGDSLRVTRLPTTEEERAACGPITVATRVTKYDLERLTSQPQLTFNIPRADQAKLRLAAHRHMIKTGWQIRCRLQDDGTMLVYRVTEGPAPAPAAATEAAPEAAE